MDHPRRRIYIWRTLELRLPNMSRVACPPFLERQCRQDQLQISQNSQDMHVQPGAVCKFDSTESS